MGEERGNGGHASWAGSGVWAWPPLSLFLSLSFFSLLPVGPACPLTVSPQLAKKDPTAHWGSACPFWTDSSILVNMCILPFEFSISEPSVILTLAFQDFSDGLSMSPLVTLLVWGGHIHRYSRETAASFQVPGWL